MSRGEEITNAFYDFEEYGRGHLLYTSPVEIEPPFFPINFSQHKKPYKDDGKVSLFGSLKKAFESKKQEHTEKRIEPYTAHVESELTVELTLLFTQSSSSLVNSRELLTMLSYTSFPFSIEWKVQKESISLSICTSIYDVDSIVSLLESYFPDIIIQQHALENHSMYVHEDIGICDYALAHEYMCPTKGLSNHALDPLRLLPSLQKLLVDEEYILIQTIIKGVTQSWSSYLPHAVSDGTGKSLLEDFPQLPALTKEKTSSPLFAVTMRSVALGNSKERSWYLLTETSKRIAQASQSQYNSLIPLSNKGLSLEQHINAVKKRQSYRTGMILNLDEVMLFAHIPPPEVIPYLAPVEIGAYKTAPNFLSQGTTYLGVNSTPTEHNHIFVDDDIRTKHMFLIGGTGSGKTNTLTNLFLSDIERGVGATFIDPHGDVAEELLGLIPSHRLNDVIIIDPSDFSHPVGFNLLHAPTLTEQMILSSDMVETFRKASVSWGDVMSSVLANAIMALTLSDDVYTLFDLKRFLREDKHRAKILSSVEDPQVHYFFKYDFSDISQKQLRPLYTRLDTFLRPQPLRNLFIQPTGVNFTEALSDNSIIIVKLALGLIGESNASLLGSLIVSKINQAAFARQQLKKEDRTPYYLYIDEMQHCVSQSMSSLLSGTRKYGLGGVFSTQDLSQLNKKHPEVVESMLSNAYTRICMRVSESDAKVMAQGFTGFEYSDITQQSVGHGIARVGGSNNDFNITFPLVSRTPSDHQREELKKKSRERYGVDQEEIEQLIQKAFGVVETKTKKKEAPKVHEVSKVIEQTIQEPTVNDDSKNQEDSLSLKQQIVSQETLREHEYLKVLVKKLAHDRGFKVVLEHNIDPHGRVDVHLENVHVKIAVEVSVNNTPEYEVGSIQGCLNAGYEKVIMVSKEVKHLRAIESYSKEKLSTEVQSKVVFTEPHELPFVLDSYIEPEPKEKIVRGYRIKTRYEK